MTAGGLAGIKDNQEKGGGSLRQAGRQAGSERKNEREREKARDTQRETQKETGLVMALGEASRVIGGVFRLTCCFLSQRLQRRTPEYTCALRGKKRRRVYQYI
jgi:hypothetical protein